MRLVRVAALATTVSMLCPTTAAADTVNGNRLYFEKPVPAGQWFAQTPGAQTFVPIDPLDFLLVPGDTLEMRVDVTLRATGPATGRFTVSTADVTPDNELKRALTVTTTTSLPSGTLVTEQDAGRPISVRVRLYFDESTPRRVAHDQTVRLGNTVLRVQGDDAATPDEPTRPDIPSDDLPGRDVPNRVPIGSVPAG